MRPHFAGKKQKPTLRAKVVVKHPAKVRVKPAARLRDMDQTRQFTGIKRALKRLKPEDKKPGVRITETMLALAKGNKRQSAILASQVFAMAKPMPGVVPKGKATIAMDEAIETALGWAAQSIYAGAFQQGVTFLGYPYLAELAQRAEYRRVSEVIATEMTRKWIEIKVRTNNLEDEVDAAGEELEDELGVEEKPSKPGQPPNPNASNKAVGKPAMDAFLPKPTDTPPAKPAGPPDDPAASADEEDDPQAQLEAAKNDLKAQKAKEKEARVHELEEELKRLNVQDCFRKIAEQDGFFGRAHLFIELDKNDGSNVMLRPELVIPIGDGQNAFSKAKITKGSITRLKTVEAIWCYPANYNSNNPLADNWYAPSLWFVQGMEVHASRLLTFVGREVPDMLKPAYSFGGLSLSQMVQPTVQNWLRTRQSVSDIVHSFSVFILSTQMGQDLNEDGDQIFKRADFFNDLRDNRGLMIIDKESEEFANVAAPLSTLDALQAQSQEHICSVSGLPLVKYTGISPSGLNATSEFEIAAFYDWIKAYQIAFFQPGLTRIFHMAQLNLWGEIDEDLYFEFQPLAEQTEEEKATTRKTEADTDKVHIDSGVLSPEEVRGRLSKEADGPYAGIDVNNVPEPPAPPGGDPFGQGKGFDEDGPGGKNDKTNGPPGD